MSRINVIVATDVPEVMAEVVARRVAARQDMNLVEGRCLSSAEVEAILRSGTSYTPCALVLVGPPSETSELEEHWLAARDDLVVMRVEVVGSIVRIGLKDPRLDSLLTAVRELVDRFGVESRERIARVQLQLTGASTPDEPQQLPEHLPLLHASINWVRAILRNAIRQLPGDEGDVHGFALTRATVEQSLDPLSLAAPGDQLRDFEAALDSALADAENPEPLSIAARVFELGPLDFRMMLLTLAPDLDFRFQRSLGFLLDDMSRRVGTLSLYGSLLDMTAREIGEIKGGPLAYWLVLDAGAHHRSAADEPARIDPFLVQWLLGETSALEHDPRVRRMLHPEPWPGAALLTGQDEQTKSLDLADRLRAPASASFVVLEGAPANWRALVELGAELSNLRLYRIEAARLKDLDLLEIQECAVRVGRLVRLTGSALAIDVTNLEFTEPENDALSHFLGTLFLTGCAAALICDDAARIVRLLGAAPFELMAGEPLTAGGRVEAVREATKRLGIESTTLPVHEIAGRYPLDVDDFEHAIVLAASRSNTYDEVDPEEFHTACKEFASRGVSNLVDRIEPVFTLDDVVLPEDRKQQLKEIVDQVRFASHVLDAWNFGEKLPYGRGVAVLFSGPSGTGKTMAAMGIARELGIQILRLDLSKVVSKFIGETEKNISRVFTDAQKSGAAILIDEADALLGKRSEVKDAHDRYANIEVAYLLQRMETFDGLVILTTNMRKNLDTAFLRRLRHVVEFAKPGPHAREEIWRQCLPLGSYDLDDADFRHLARRIDLTGGQIRQITLRAAFTAVAANRRINMEDIERATHAEFTKIGMPPIELVREPDRRAA